MLLGLISLEQEVLDQSPYVLRERTERYKKVPRGAATHTLIHLHDSFLRFTFVRKHVYMCLDITSIFQYIWQRWEISTLRERQWKSAWWDWDTVQRACMCIPKQSQNSSVGSLLLVSGFEPHFMDSNVSDTLLFQLLLDIFLVSVYWLILKFKP